LKRWAPLRSWAHLRSRAPQYNQGPGHRLLIYVSLFHNDDSPFKTDSNSEVKELEEDIEQFEEMLRRKKRRNRKRRSSPNFSPEKRHFKICFELRGPSIH
jgi:hypothetical protein